MRCWTRVAREDARRARRPGSRARPPARAPRDLVVAGMSRNGARSASATRAVARDDLLDARPRATPGYATPARGSPSKRIGLAWSDTKKPVDLLGRDASPTSPRRRPCARRPTRRSRSPGTARERPEIGTFCPVAGVDLLEVEDAVDVRARRPSRSVVQTIGREDRHEARQLAPCSPRRRAASSSASGPPRRAGRGAPSRGRRGRAR